MLSPYDHNGRLKPLPLGDQVFEKIIAGGVTYVDKTKYVYEMTRPGNTFVFLSRPRRFGKSMLCYTLKAFFQGKRELFAGLALHEMASAADWDAHPVIMLSMNICKRPSAEGVEIAIGSLLSDYEKEYGISPDSREDIGSRLRRIISGAREQTGKSVVVIIDEYDAPLLGVLHDEDTLKAVREVMKGFYEILKPSEDHLRFVFITGITKFAQLSLFSTFNNINNISVDDDYAAVCGITPEEIESQLGPYVRRLAERDGKSYGETLDALRQTYDGYHFTESLTDTYNPFSLIMALSKRKIASYWFESGTSTFLLEMMKRFGTLPTQIERVKAKVTDFDQSTDALESIVPLLYQSGYLTIKSYDADLDEYTLGIPNNEVRQGLMSSLAKSYAGTAYMPMKDSMMEIRRAIANDDMDAALGLIRDFLKTVPYADVTNREGHYQQMLFIIFSLMGAYTDTEVRTSKGRIDVVMATRRRLYIIEIKLNKSAATALEQIESRDYFSRFLAYELPITKIGVNFNSEERTITDWETMA